MKINASSVVACLLLAGCSAKEEPMQDTDYLWLEEVESQSALDWVQLRN